MKHSLKYTLFLSFFVFLSAQDFGKIAGKVYDKHYGDAIIGAYVMISGMSIGSTTDIDGNFSFETPVGTYDLKVEYIGYNTVTIKQIHVEKDKTSSYNIALDESVNASDVVVVEAKVFQNNENGLLVAQKKSEKMFDAISSEQISKSGDSNLGEALKKVTGLTVVGGKNVFVRGLGERYSNVQLNGSVLPSTNPDKKEVPMNIFSSSIVDNIIVQKAYTADQPGEFSGGSVQIKTKEFPEEKILKLGYSTSINDNDLGSNYLSSREGSIDWLGFNGGTRQLPSALNKKGALIGNLSKSEQKRIVSKLSSAWTPSNKSVIPNQGLSFTYGDNFQFENGRAFGLIGSAQYKHSNSANDLIKESSVKFHNIDEGKSSANLTTMLNGFYKLSSNTKVGIKNLFTNSGENAAKQVNTSDTESGKRFRQTVFKFVQSQLFSSNIQYETYFKSFYESKLNIDGSYATATRIEPNTRNTYYTEKNVGEYRVEFSDKGNRHFFSDQKDMNIVLRSDYELKPSTALKLKVGVHHLIKDRSFRSDQLFYDKEQGHIIDEAILKSNPEDVFVPENLDKSMTINSAYSPDNSYEAKQHLFSTYVNSQLKLNDELSLTLGARLENWNLNLQNDDLSLNTTHKKLDVLPALNVVYNLNESSNIRFAFSNTLARPEFRELSNVTYSEFVGDVTFHGNPELKRTRINNMDLKYETFGNAGDMVSVSTFYKKFSNPIEVVFWGNANNEVQPQNADHATLYGVELEGRYSLTNSLRFVGNISLIHSEITVPEGSANVSKTRGLQGQSPYIINSSVYYTPFESAFDLSLSFNRFGKRISRVGNVWTANGDEFEHPFNKLDFLAKYKLDTFSFKLSFKNILNEEVRFSQKSTTNKTLQSKVYKKGRSLSLGVSHNF